jgi:hypothetical protein
MTSWKNSAKSYPNKKSQIHNFVVQQRPIRPSIFSTHYTNKTYSRSLPAQAQVHKHNWSATRLQAYNLNGGSNEALREKRSTTACSEVICMPAQPSSPWQQPAALHKHK